MHKPTFDSLVLSGGPGGPTTLMPLTTLTPVKPETLPKLCSVCGSLSALRVVTLEREAEDSTSEALSVLSIFLRAPV